MNYMNIANSVPALREITQLRLPYAKARDIYKACKLFEEEYNFFLQEEKKLVEEYAARTKDGNLAVAANGAITFKSQEAKQEYVKKFTELGLQECDINIKPIKLNAEEFGNQMISPETMARLAGIIDFE